MIYDNQTRSMLQTDEQFPSIGGQSKGLDESGTSIDVYFGPKAPVGNRATGCRPCPTRAGT